MSKILIYRKYKYSYSKIKYISFYFGLSAQAAVILAGNFVMQHAQIELVNRQIQKNAQIELNRKQGKDVLIVLENGEQANGPNVLLHVVKAPNQEMLTAFTHTQIP